MSGPEQKVGNIDGWFGLLFKLNLVAIPICLSGIVTLLVWLVQTTNENSSSLALVTQRVDSWEAKGPRYSAVDAKADHLTTRESILEYVRVNYPPQWLKETIDLYSREIEALREFDDKIYDRVERIEQKN